MASNHKLTELLKGRKITGTQNAAGKLHVTFDDRSVMTVKTAGGSNSASADGTVNSVRQADTKLHLDFENRATMEITTAEATSSVMVRDKDPAIEYAD